MPEVQEEMRRVLAAHGPPETTRTSRRRRGRRASTGRRRVPERLGQRPGRWCPWPPRPRPRPPGAPAAAVWTAGSSLLLPGSAACRSTDEPNPGRGPVPARPSRAGTASTLTWIPGRSRPRRGGARRRPPRRRLARRWRHARSPSGTSAPSIRTIRRLGSDPRGMGQRSAPVRPSAPFDHGPVSDGRPSRTSPRRQRLHSPSWTAPAPWVSGEGQP